MASYTTSRDATTRDEGADLLRALVPEQPTLTTAEYAAEWTTRTGISTSVAAMHRALTELGLRQGAVATDRDRPRVTALRETFDQWVKTVAPDRRCFFVDEAGSFIGMRRRFGRAPDGQRVHTRQPRSRGTCLTMNGALSANGLEAMMTNLGDARAWRERSGRPTQPTRNVKETGGHYTTQVTETPDGFRVGIASPTGQ